MPSTADTPQVDTHVALAVDLFNKNALSMGKAAKLAEMSHAQFIEQLSEQGVAVADYPAPELDDELAALNKA